MTNRANFSVTSLRDSLPTKKNMEFCSIRLFLLSVRIWLCTVEPALVPPTSIW